MSFPDFSSPQIWVSLVTLTFLEIVLGVDNIIFVSLVANKLDPEQRSRGRNIGLTLALVFRVLLLLGISWIISLDKPVLDVPYMADSHDQPVGLSIKDLILIAGGIFLIYKSVTEIHHKLEGQAHDANQNKAKAAFSAVIAQIVLVNIVFSFDSILTAIGLTKEVMIMMIAVVVSMLVMMAFSSAISAFINRHPTMQMLALSFLILIGFLLVVEGFHQHVSKGYVYFAIAFSLAVETLNIRLRKTYTPIQLHGPLEQAGNDGLINR
jgi:predicted tellurium resistance membrane protein TerC